MALGSGVAIPVLVFTRTPVPGRVKTRLIPAIGAARAANLHRAMLWRTVATAAGDMVDVGQGIIDFPAIFASSEEAGIEHYFVEHDEPADSLASVRRSYEWLVGVMVGN